MRQKKSEKYCFPVDIFPAFRGLGRWIFYLVVIVAPLANDRAKAVRLGFAFVSCFAKDVDNGRDWKTKLIKLPKKNFIKLNNLRCSMLVLYKPFVASLFHSPYLMVMCYVKTALSRWAKDRHSTFH